MSKIVVKQIKTNLFLTLACKRKRKSRVYNKAVKKKTILNNKTKIAMVLNKSTQLYLSLKYCPNHSIKESIQKTVKYE